MITKKNPYYFLLIANIPLVKYFWQLKCGTKGVLLQSLLGLRYLGIIGFQGIKSYSTFGLIIFSDYYGKLKIPRRNHRQKKKLNLYRNMRKMIQVMMTVTRLAEIISLS